MKKVFVRCPHCDGKLFTDPNEWNFKVDKEKGLISVTFGRKYDPDRSLLQHYMDTKRYENIFGIADMFGLKLTK